MITLIIVLVIYLLSVRGSYLFIQKAHYDPMGRWQSVNPTLSDLILILIPIYNTFSAIDYLIGSWEDDKYKKEFTFFKPKDK